ncbi:MAG TPA: metallophosphoesterase family protein [Caulobacteraceae bacterium]|nr:metallophosphoesterase family protein [Caulobacteraceae bacterium]
MNARLSYAVGDIHGRADLLEEALRLIGAHRPGEARRIIFLGDYVDRGPESAAVVDRLMGLTAAGEAICLKGNHEAMMLDALAGGGASDLSLWLANGGAQTLAAYSSEDCGGIGVPESHMRWLGSLPLMTQDPNRIFVHAGLAPGIPLERQWERVVLWIRDRFLEAGSGVFDKHIVHGHTPLWAGKPDPAEPELLAQRTNLDTGAWMTGRLTVGVFDAEVPGGPVEILTARGATGV